MTTDPLKEFFEELFKDPLERKIIAGAMGNRDPDELVKELLAELEAQ